MKRITWILIGVITSALGMILVLAGLTRLGWGRHGVSRLDFGFLHLDWIFQPELPYWRAHMGNLATAFIGLLFMVGPLSCWAWYLLRKRNHSRKESS